MVGIVYHVASSFAGALWSTTCHLLDALVASQERLEKRAVGHAPNSETSSTYDRALDSKQLFRRSRQAESSHDLRASSKPVSMKPQTQHTASLDNQNMGYSQVHPLLNTDHLRKLRHSQSMPNLIGPSRERRHKSTRPRSMITTSQEPFVDPTHITGNPIISRSETSRLPTSPLTMRGVRFADKKDMQSVTGRRHVGKVTDNEWKASNKALMMVRRMG
ncbi:hypothetical protein HBI18_203130 [Parastagonospora nodorum]|nr:hypothetical protein HBH75_202920 [Parastagonospora nodorum]KAH5419631.1 hypothetical protein HBI32_096400 [Parastagonospora nodorum]KAH5651785.1 hypothetical protein HBI51_081770 [Parastagonospora nodorum]KAH5713307.1 hypothetical protein HBI18_203130 [Parastagonospora nodorum]KAH6100792.1 hypothetical protein HBI69_217710 [Parastagonospora nodorum]